MCFFHCINFSVGLLPPCTLPLPNCCGGNYHWKCCWQSLNLAICVPYIFDNEPIICNSQKRQLLNTTDMRWKSKGSLNLQGTNFYKYFFFVLFRIFFFQNSCISHPIWKQLSWPSACLYLLFLLALQTQFSDIWWAHKPFGSWNSGSIGKGFCQVQGKQNSQISLAPQMGRLSWRGSRGFIIRTTPLAPLPHL